MAMEQQPRRREGTTYATKLIPTVVTLTVASSLMYWLVVRSTAVSTATRTTRADADVAAAACPPHHPASCLPPWAGRDDVPDDWWTYLTAVYGAGGVAFPFDPATLAVFYWDRGLPFREGAAVVPFADRREAPPGHLRECGDAGALWCVRVVGGAGAGAPRWRAGRRVEVSRGRGADGAAVGGLWFFYAPGSGVYLELGRTLHFRNESALCDYVANRTQTRFDCTADCCAPLHRYLIPRLHRMGIETVVLTDGLPDGGASDVEIWDVREIGARAEGRHLFRGFGGAVPCVPDASRPYLRCVPPAPAALAAVVTGDMHGHVDGVPALAALVRRQRAATPTLLFGAGDAFLGSAFFRRRGPAALGAAYRPLRYDALGLGNHDLEYREELAAFAAAAGSPLVCFNLRRLPGVVPWAKFPARDACATGFTTLDHGVVNETALEYARPGGAAFWRELTATLNAMRGEGCMLIFVLGHGGLSIDVEVAEKTPSSVVVLGGHDHDIVFEESYRDPSRIVMHTGALLLQAGVLELNLTTDPKSGVKTVLEAHGKMVPLVDEASRLVGNDGPVLLELSWPRHAPPFHSQDCRSGRCPLGDAVAELMFLAGACRGNSTDVVVGALREAGSVRSTLGRRSTESELREVLLWNNDLVVAELRGRDIARMLVRSNESIAQDGGGAALSLFGVRAGATDGDVQVLTEKAAGDRCRRWREASRGANPAVFGPGPEEVPGHFRRLRHNDTVLVTVTEWLWRGGDGFVVPDTPPVRIVGPEVDEIVALLAATGRPGAGIFGVALGAVMKGLVAALVYGCSRAQARDIVFRRGNDYRRCSFARLTPCARRPGCLITVVAVGIGHFLFWGILRTARLGHGMVANSMIASFVVTVVENPLWVIITKLQAADDNAQDSKQGDILTHKVDNLHDEANAVDEALSEDNGNISPDQTLPPTWLTWECRNFVAIASTIWTTKGPTGLYAGLSSNLLLTIHPMLQANLYSICVRVLASLVHQEVGDATSEQDLLSRVPWLSVVAGIASTAVATLVTYPLQVIRIRLQTEQPPFVGRYYDGIAIKGLQGLFSAAVSFFFMDYVAHHLRSFNLEKFVSSVSSNLGD